MARYSDSRLPGFSKASTLRKEYGSELLKGGRLRAIHGIHFNKHLKFDALIHKGCGPIALNRVAKCIGHLKCGHAHAGYSLTIHRHMHFRRAVLGSAEYVFAAIRPADARYHSGGSARLAIRLTVLDLYN